MFDPNTRVLIVDDMVTMRKIVRKTLKEIGLSNAVEASDGQKAWDALQTTNPPIQLIVSDWNMPNTTGLEFLRLVRADKRFAHLPFLMVTAEAEQHQVLEALKAGVSNYVVKPFTPAALREKLEAIYRKHAAPRAA